MITFKTNERPFFDTLVRKVDDYFKATGKNRWGDWTIYLKSFLLIGSFFSLYFFLVFVDMPAWLSLLLCALMGLTLAGIGFNLMHDGAHGSFSDRRWLNNMMGYALNMVGGDVDLWKSKHNQIHHGFTNILGHDDDIDIQPILRTHNDQPRYWFHRFQHIYGFIAYGLTYFSWVWRDDMQKYFKMRIGNTRLKKFPWHRHLIFWGTKVIYAFSFVVLPMITKGFGPALLGYAVTTVVCGIVIGVVFQLAHVVENTAFHNPEREGSQLETEWAIHQLQTTSNFATRSKWVHWFTGGLNHQVEHHLFPRISHVHYPALSKIVRETCEQFGVAYNEHPTVLTAVRSHVSYLRQIGRYD